MSPGGVTGVSHAFEHLKINASNEVFRAFSEHHNRYSGKTYTRSSDMVEEISHDTEMKRNTPQSANPQDGFS